MRIAFGKPDFMSTAVAAAGEKRRMLAEWLDLDAGPHAATGVRLIHAYCVLPVKQANLARAMVLGASVERSGIFLEGICTVLLQVLGRGEVKAVCYENGGFPGYTREAACAAACTAYRLGLMDHICRVELAGKTAVIEITEEELVFLTEETSLEQSA